MKVILSGCHAGQNPSPGLGTARSIRLGFPEAHLIAKDHSVQCSGLHHPVFDAVWVCRAWDELDLQTHQFSIAERLAEGAYYISGLDIEAMWLSALAIPGTLVPPAGGFARTTKPAISAMENIPGVRVPPWLLLDEPPSALLAFARRHNWRLWVKGAAYEARRVTKPHQLEEARTELGSTWGREGLFLQAEVEGHECCVAISAYRGELLEAVCVEKRHSTSEGKTWVGSVGPVEPQLRRALAGLVAELEWTGGAELEFVRDESGTLWILDLNPRFPAWIHGATLAGYNLPAQLMAAASGSPAPGASPGEGVFTRVVLEIPTRPELPLPRPRGVTPDVIDAGDGKHPSGMPQLHRRLRGRSRNAPTGRPFAAPWLAELITATHGRPTPYRWALTHEGKKRFADLAERAATLRYGPPLRLAYSVKTNPDSRWLELALRNGLLAEVISPQETACVLETGFKQTDLVHNGPLPLPPGTRHRCHAAFADSLESLSRLRELVDGVLGARLRPPGLASRFGIEVENPREMGHCVELLARDPGKPLGVSMHAQSSAIGLQRWMQAAGSIIDLAKTLGELTRRPITHLDLGGGWTWDDTNEVFETVLPRLLKQADRVVPGLREVMIEPGKSLVDPLEVLVTRIVERRRRSSGDTVVSDGSVAELPMCRLRPPRLIVVGQGRAEELGPGGDQIFGRLCIESDVLHNGVKLPDWLEAGDLMLCLDVGGYDRSMGHAFGTGYAHG